MIVIKGDYEFYGQSVRVDYFHFFFFSSRRRHTRFDCDWSSDVCSSDLTREGSDAICRRAYWLGPNLERVAERRKPQFVRADLSLGLEPIPMLGSREPLEIGRASCRERV